MDPFSNTEITTVNDSKNLVFLRHGIKIGKIYAIGILNEFVLRNPILKKGSFNILGRKRNKIGLLIFGQFLVDHFGMHNHCLNA